MHRTDIVALLLVLLSSQSPGQTPSFQFEALSVEHGLSQSSVWSTIQDSYGFMWFGTADGLNKYDGYTFQVYRHDPQDSTSLSNNTVWTLFEDRTGHLWIGTVSGLDRYIQETDRGAWQKSRGNGLHPLRKQPRRWKPVNTDTFNRHVHRSLKRRILFIRSKN